MQEYFEFLEDLRDSGIMNMMGAPRELQHEFGLDRAEAREVFQKWCDSLQSLSPPYPLNAAQQFRKKSPRRFSARPPREGASVKYLIFSQVSFDICRYL